MMSTKHSFPNRLDEMEQQKKKAQEIEQQETAKKRRWLQWLLWGGVFIGATTAIVVAGIATGGTILPVIGAGIAISFGLGVAVTAVSFVVTQAIRKIANMVRNLRSPAKKTRTSGRLKGSPRFTKLKESLLNGSEHKEHTDNFTQPSAERRQTHPQKKKDGFLKRTWSGIKNFFGFNVSRKQSASHAKINQDLSGRGELDSRDLVILANRSHGEQDTHKQSEDLNHKKGDASQYPSRLEACIEKHTNYMESLKKNLAKLNDPDPAVRNAAQKERKTILTNLSQFMPTFIKQIKVERLILSTDTEKRKFYLKMVRFFHTDHYQTHLQAQELSDYKQYFIAYEEMQNEVPSNDYYSDEQSFEIWRETGTLWYRLYREWLNAQLKYQEKWLAYSKIRKIDADYSMLKVPFMELKELHEAELKCFDALLVKKNTPGFLKAADISLDRVKDMEDIMRITKSQFRMLSEEVEKARLRQEKKEQEEAAERERARQQEAKRQEDLAKKFQGKGNDKANDVSYETLSSSSSQESFSSDSTHITEEELSETEEDALTEKMQEHVSVSDKHGGMFHEHPIEEELLGNSVSLEKCYEKK